MPRTVEEEMEIARKIIDIVCTYYSIPYRVFTTASRKRRLVIARYAAMYLIDLNLGLITRIQAPLFNRNRSDIPRGIEAFKAWLPQDDKLRRQFGELKSKVKELNING